MKQFIFLLSIIILNSCVDQASSDIEYVIFNQTDKTVKVLGFDRDFDNPENTLKAEPITINPNSNFKVTRVTGLDDNLSMSFYSLKNGVDSVRVIFDNKKVSIFSRTPPQPCNICDGNDNNQHFITEANYNSAEDCNGNCN